MRIRNEQTEGEPESDPKRAAARRPASPFTPEVLLQLQRSAGNAAVARLLSRQAAAAEAVSQTWTAAEVLRIQQQLRRLRVYEVELDGILGKGTDQGLVEAFGGDEWRSLDAATVLARLREGEPQDRPHGGHDLRYGELLKDGLLDLTFGYGYLEGTPLKSWAMMADSFAEQLASRGYVEDAALAHRLYASAGRKVGGFGRFFVKQHALTYMPPAGSPRPIPAIVRFLINPGGDKGAEEKAAYEESVTGGDATYYFGHGRFGTGPDFDRNFAKFTLLDEHGKVEAELEDYHELGKRLAAEGGGDAWSRFQWRLGHERIKVAFSNDANVRINTAGQHDDEFGGRLLNWALDQTGTKPATGKDGELAAQAAQHPERRYRLLVFDGCRSQDYEHSIRATPGFDTRSADVVESTRTLGIVYEAKSFAAFLDAIVAQQSAEEVVAAMNTVMKENEWSYSTPPYKFSGTGDNLHR